MTDHIGEATKKVIDLDALEKLADEAGGKTFWTASKSGLPQHRNVSFYIYNGGVQLAETNGDLPHIAAFMEGVSPATIKALIAEVRSLRKRVARWEPPMMTSTASSPCSAFLARNGKREG